MIYSSSCFIFCLKKKKTVENIAEETTHYQNTGKYTRNKGFLSFLLCFLYNWNKICIFFSHSPQGQKNEQMQKGRKEENLKYIKVKMKPRDVHKYCLLNYKMIGQNKVGFSKVFVQHHLTQKERQNCSLGKAFIKMG